MTYEETKTKVIQKYDFLMLMKTCEAGASFGIFYGRLKINSFLYPYEPIRHVEILANDPEEKPISFYADLHGISTKIIESIEVIKKCIVAYFKYLPFLPDNSFELVAKKKFLELVEEYSQSRAGCSEETLAEILSFIRDTDGRLQMNIVSKLALV